MDMEASLRAASHVIDLYDSLWSGAPRSPTRLDDIRSQLATLNAKQATLHATSLSLRVAIIAKLDELRARARVIEAAELARRGDLEAKLATHDDIRSQLAALDARQVMLGATSLTVRAAFSAKLYKLREIALVIEAAKLARRDELKAKLARSDNIRSQLATLNTKQATLGATSLTVCAEISAKLAELRGHTRAISTKVGTKLALLNATRGICARNAVIAPVAATSARVNIAAPAAAPRTVAAPLEPLSSAALIKEDAASPTAPCSLGTSNTASEPTTATTSAPSRGASLEGIRSVQPWPAAQAMVDRGMSIHNDLLNELYLLGEGGQGAVMCVQHKESSASGRVERAAKLPHDNEDASLYEEDARSLVYEALHMDDVQARCAGLPAPFDGRNVVRVHHLITGDYSQGFPMLCTNPRGEEEVVPLFGFTTDLMTGDAFQVMNARAAKCSLIVMLTIMHKLAAAISSLGRAGYAHLDIKLTNLFVMEVDGRLVGVKLGDMGLSMKLGEPVSGVDGSAGHMAPEHLNARRWCGDDIPGLDTALTWACDILPGQLPQLFKQCLAVDPEQRPTAHAVWEALGQELEVQLQPELEMQQMLAMLTPGYKMEVPEMLVD
ncbi:hypothetical protein FOA52_000092 [Chlamydomonas sp. UWO 241]|nr:hypothetical protein FOA52_000092 [Chlamydomonas sp. UWO 241]